MSKKTGLFAEVNNLADGGQRVAKSRQGNIREIRELVGEVRPEDGMDPRYEAKRGRSLSGQSRPGFTHGVHKQEQLGCQIQSAVETALQCATTPLLSGLTVREVVKQKAVLTVIAVPRNPTEPIDLAAAATALQQAGPALRREVAAAITRKEVPNLRFMVLPAGAEKIEE